MQNNNLKSRIVEIIRSSEYSDAVGKIYLFGSCARGEATEDSDVDIMVELVKPMGWEFFGLNNLLEEKLGRKVDLATTNSIKPHARDTVEQDKVLLSS